MDYVYFDYHDTKKFNKVCFYGIMVGQSYVGKVPQYNVVMKSNYISPYDTKRFKSSIRHMSSEKIDTWILHITSHLKIIEEAKSGTLEIKYLDDFIQSIEISPIGATILRYYIASKLSVDEWIKEDRYKDLLSIEKYYINILKLLNNRKVKI